MRALPLLALAPLIVVTSGTADPGAFSPNGDGRKDTTTFTFAGAIATDSLFPAKTPAGVFRWTFDARLTVAGQTIEREIAVPVPHPFVDDVVAAKAPAGEFVVGANESRTLPAGDYAVTRLKIAGTLTVTGRAVFYVRGPVELHGSLNDGGDPRDLWIVQAG